MSNGKWLLLAYFWEPVRKSLKMITTNVSVDGNIFCRLLDSIRLENSPMYYCMVLDVNRRLLVVLVYIVDSQTAYRLLNAKTKIDCVVFLSHSNLDQSFFLINTNCSIWFVSSSLLHFLFLKSCSFMILCLIYWIKARKKTIAHLRYANCLPTGKLSNSGLEDRQYLFKPSGQQMRGQQS